MKLASERRLLQVSILIGGLVPLLAGGYGALVGASMLENAATPQLDNHFRYLSGLLLGIGLCFWSFLPTIERRTAEVRTLTALVVVGGLCRAGGILMAGETQMPHFLALAMELAVTPLLCAWQGRVAARTKKEEAGASS